MTEQYNGKLVGFNSNAPFATENHSFISSNNKRFALNPQESFKTHRSPVEKLENGVTLIQNGKEIIVDQIVENEENTQVYNLFTTDGSFVVNGYSVNDDFPQLSLYPTQTLRIFHILKHQEQQGVEQAFMDARSLSVNPEDLPSVIAEFIQISQSRPEILQQAIALWTTHFEELSDCVSESSVLRALEEIKA